MEWKWHRMAFRAFFWHVLYVYTPSEFPLFVGHLVAGKRDASQCPHVSVRHSSCVAKNMKSTFSPAVLPLTVGHRTFPTNFATFPNKPS